MTMKQWELADRIGVSQPRIAAIERSKNVTIAVLDQYVRAVGGSLEVAVVRSGRRTALFPTKRTQTPRSVHTPKPQVQSKKRAAG